MLPPILPITTETYNDIWSKIDANFLKSIESIEIPLAGIDANKIKLKLFDGTYITGPVIPFPVTGANNGMSFLAGIIKLGGVLLAGTTIDTSTFNFLIQSGTTAQRFRISNTFSELAGALELRIAPPSIDASTAIVDQVLKVKNASTGRCEYEYIKSSDFTSLSIVGDKVRLTFKDASFIETAGLPSNPFGSCSKNNIATATVLLLNTPTLIAGTTSGVYLNQFIHNGAGRLTYTGTDPIFVEIERTSNIYTVAGANQIIRTQFYKNGAIIGVPTTDNHASNGANNIQSRSTYAIVQLITNDYIEMFATNETSANNIVERDMTFKIKKI